MQIVSNEDNMHENVKSFPPANRIWHFVQIVSNGDNLHNMSNSVSLEN